MTTPTIRAALEGLVAAYALCRGNYEEYWPDHLDGPMAAADGALKANPDAEALAARPLVEQVAAMSDCIGAQTVGQITAISNRAAAWLRENPPGQQVAIEPKSCPMLGACSCVEPASPAPEPPIQPDGRSGLTWKAAILGLRDVLADQTESAVQPVWQRSQILAAIDLMVANSTPPAPQTGEGEGDLRSAEVRQRDHESCRLIGRDGTCPDSETCWTDGLPCSHYENSANTPALQGGEAQP